MLVFLCTKVLNKATMESNKVLESFQANNLVLPIRHIAVLVHVAVVSVASCVLLSECGRTRQAFLWLLQEFPFI